MFKYPERRLKPQKVSQKEIAAFHESGHTVICSKFHLNFEKVIIQPAFDENFSGLVETPGMLYASEAFRIWGATKTFSLIIVQYYAGIISEAFFCGVYNWETSQDDLFQADFVKRVINNNCSLKIDLWTLTERIVMNNWGYINCIAEELLKKDELQKEQIEKLMKQKIKHLKPSALF